MNRLRADLMLLLGTLIWGTTFIAQKQANDSMGPLTFVGVRFLRPLVEQLGEVSHVAERLGRPDRERRPLNLGVIQPDELAPLAY